MQKVPTQKCQRGFYIKMDFNVSLYEWLNTLKLKEGR